jgi:Fur family transcriptional regulator, ferric uptake regulator
VEKADHILDKKQLKKTPVRLDVLNALIGEKAALSQHEIEKKFEKHFDRITLYRTLKSFEEKGVVHRIYNSFGEAKYALCHDDCEEHAHSDHHLHFNCLQCKRTFCINEVHIPHFHLPKGMQAVHYNFSVEGVCAECQK